jgi:hypothetical protein
VSQAHEDRDEGSFRQAWIVNGLAAELCDGMRADGAGMNCRREGMERERGFIVEGKQHRILVEEHRTMACDDEWGRQIHIACRDRGYTIEVDD